VKMIIRLTVLISIVFCSTTGLTQSPSTLIKVSELKIKPFNADGLVITVKKFQVPRLVIGSLDKVRGHIEMRLENATSDFVMFRPIRFAVVGKDNKQAFLVCQRECATGPPTEIMIVPGANVEMEYDISRAVRYPAKLFYGEKLLGEITD
jgi:hypothetical protein